MCSGNDKGIPNYKPRQSSFTRVETNIMKTTEKKVRKVLNRKIIQLNDIIADIDSLLTDLEVDFFRVSIFGSARLQPESELYKEVHDLAYSLALKGVDIVTGGGPGLMDAANKGAKAGGKKTRSNGLPIQLPYETSTNAHLDVKRHHKRFSSRLDEFMRISHAVVVTPGGIGTLLELFYTWQLIQVNHIKPRPIILLGDNKMWEDLLVWIKNWTLDSNLISEQDLNHLKFSNSIDSALSYIDPSIKKFYKVNGKNK